MSTNRYLNMSKTRQQRGPAAPATKPSKGVGITQARFDAVAHGDARKYDYGCRCDACYESYKLAIRINNTTKNLCVKWLRDNKPGIYRRITQEATAKHTSPKIVKGSQVMPFDESLRGNLGIGSVTKTRPSTNEIYVEWSESPLNLAGWLPITQVTHVEA